MHRNLVIFAALLLLPLMVACSDDEQAAGGACQPDARECLDDYNFRVCRPDGSGFDYDLCPETRPCFEGLCRVGGGNNGANNGGTNNGGTNNGAGNNGPANNGPVNNGTSNNGPANNGPINNGGNNGSCAPFTRECVSATLLRVCNSSGTGWDQATCTAAQPCEGGFCSDDDGMAGTCVGGTRECIDSTTVRICRDAGTAWDNLPCDFGQFCDGGQCRALTSCQDTDGDGFGTGADCLGIDCDDTNYNINPLGAEMCGNGVDEDCDAGDAPCACDPLAQNCPGERLKCGLNRSQQFECRPNGLLGEGEPCGGIPSNCERGTICVGVNAAGSTCTRMCNPNTGSGCVGGALCGATLTSHPDVGLCTGFTRCDPVDTPTACPAGEYCQPISNRDSGCFDGGGSLGENAACNPNDSQCQSGLLCVTVDNRSVCKGWCKVSRGNTDCGRWQGEACSSIEYSFTLNGHTEQITAYGFCN